MIQYKSFFGWNVVQNSILGEIYWSESDFCWFRSKTALNCWKQFGKSGFSGLLAFLAIYYVLKLFMCQKGQNKPHGSQKGIDRIFRNLGNKFQFSSIIRIPIFSHSWSEQFSKKNAISELAFFQAIKTLWCKGNWTFFYGFETEVKISGLLENSVISSMKLLLFRFKVFTKIQSKK